MGFSRQEYWSGLSFPSPGDLPHPGIKPVSPVSPALAGQFFTTSATYGNAMESLSLQSGQAVPFSSQDLSGRGTKSMQNTQVQFVCFVSIFKTLSCRTPLA